MKMSGRPVSITVGARDKAGRLMPFLAELTTEEFVKLALGSRTEVVINLDWGRLVPLIASEFEKLRTRDINDAFHALWIVWVDAPTYEDAAVRRHKFLEVSSRAIDALAKLQSSVPTRIPALPTTLGQDIEACLDLCSQYLATLMCCIQAKREVESGSFSGNPIFKKYAEWMEGLLLDAYARSMGVQNGWISDSAHIFVLAVDEDPEVKLYVDALGDRVPVDFDPWVEFVRRSTSRRERNREITIQARLERTDSAHAALALRLREMVRWARGLRELVDAMSAHSNGSEIAESERPIK
ncbi:hypothetical protein [Stenotrophomonas sp.]|uniref:hypothetical protein n=1 Tax=Stenotrophomonas sp. TaxID=69392 RepID=UPI0028B1260A|nr:hypothetical protein [Stenotrophomonas sp.]